MKEASASFQKNKSIQVVYMRVYRKKQKEIKKIERNKQEKKNKNPTHFFI